MQSVRSFILPLFSLLVLCTLCAGLFSPQPARADDASDLQAQIDAHNKQIADLEKSIAADQATLNVLGGQHQTLQSAIKTIDVSRAQTSTQISVTQNKIAASNLKLQQLSGQISQKQYQIELDKQTLAKSLRDIADTDSSSLVEQLFSVTSLADAWISVDQNASVGEALRTHAANLTAAKVELAGQQQDVSVTKDKLSSLSSDLNTQKHSLDVTKQAKTTLLTQTKNQESTYQSQIAQKRAQQKVFEAELFAFESKLKGGDPSLITKAGHGILAPPLAVLNVTQYFGKTVDAQRLYVSGTHGGVDFAASIGTPVKAALAGTVTTTEAVKFKSGCQYGKFVLIKHANGLSTIYGHLSSVSVSPGQAVTTGQVIGYSGDTGYATGPHLHFGVYDTSGIRIVTADQLGSTNCAGIKTVAANPTAYLDPMSYL